MLVMDERLTAVGSFVSNIKKKITKIVKKKSFFFLAGVFFYASASIKNNTHTPVSRKTLCFSFLLCLRQRKKN